MNLIKKTYFHVPIKKSQLKGLGFVQSIWHLDWLYKRGRISDIEHTQWMEWVTSSLSN